MPQERLCHTQVTHTQPAPSGSQLRYSSSRPSPAPPVAEDSVHSVVVIQHCSSHCCSTAHPCSVITSPPLHLLTKTLSFWLQQHTKQSEAGLKVAGDHVIAGWASVQCSVPPAWCWQAPAQARTGGPKRRPVAGPGKVAAPPPPPAARLTAYIPATGHRPATAAPTSLQASTNGLVSF